MEWVIVGLILAALVTLGLLGTVAYFKGVTIEPPIPVYKEQLGKLTDDYLHDNGYWPGQSPRRSSHAKEHSEWQTEYDALVILNEPKVIRAGSAYEDDLLKIINAFTIRYGFEHPKTQAVVTKHQQFMRRWNREMTRWAYDKDGNIL